jgi:glycosyltransferase involved in cell wall biosynthesis
LKIIYIHQYFKTPEQGGAIRSYYLATSLVKKGIEVEMITSHSGSSYEKKIIDGITIHYLPVNYNNKFGFLKRIVSFFLFSVKAYNLAKNIQDADLCYATSTPLTVGWTAMRLKKNFNIPYYFEVRDSWPLAPVQMGILKNKALIRFLYALELKIYEKANIIIALSPGIKADILSKIKKPILMLPNISDCSFYEITKKNETFVEMFDVKNKFVITYAGAIGVVNHLEYLLNIAQKCLENNLEEVVFFVAGDGATYENIKQKAHELGLKNIRFVGFLQRNDLKKLYNITDATYTSFLKLPVLETNSPNKLFDSLASGKLTIVNSLGWTKELVEENACGFYADPENPEEFVAKIKIFVSDPTVLEDFQQNARNLAEKQFSRDVAGNLFCSLFEEAEIRKLNKPTQVYSPTD